MLNSTVFLKHDLSNNPNYSGTQFITMFQSSLSVPYVEGISLSSLFRTIFFFFGIFFPHFYAVRLDICPCCYLSLGVLHAATGKFHSKWCLFTHSLCYMIFSILFLQFHCLNKNPTGFCLIFFSTFSNTEPIYHL